MDEVKIMKTNWTIARINGDVTVIARYVDGIREERELTVAYSVIDQMHRRNVQMEMK